MVSEFRAKFIEVKEEYGEKTFFILWVFYFKRLFEFAWRLLSAQYYLRNCKKGKWVTTRKKPLIFARGQIELGDRVVIWSIFQRSILSVHTKAKLKIGKRLKIISKPPSLPASQAAERNTGNGE